MARKITEKAGEIAKNKEVDESELLQAMIMLRDKLASDSVSNSK